MSMNTFAQPADIAQACELLDGDPWGSKVIAGGTAVVLMLRQGLIAPETLVSIADIPGLDGITRTDHGIRIGAMTTLDQIARSPLVRTEAGAVATACSVVGNPRIRHVATIGGNLAEADYASDPPATLAAHGATCTVVGPRGTRTVPVIDLITGFYETVLDHSELITSVEIPIQTPPRRGVYLKYRSRSSEDRACVGVAAAVRLDGDQIVELDVVIAAVAPTLQRVGSVLEQVRGESLDRSTIERIAGAYAQAIEPMEDARGSAWYRTKMIRVFVDRALTRLSPDQDLAGRTYRG